MVGCSCNPLKVRLLAGDLRAAQEMIRLERGTLKTYSRFDYRSGGPLLEDQIESRSREYEKNIRRIKQ